MQLEVYSCTECNKIYWTKSGLTKHIKVHHQSSGFKCKSIDKDFLVFLVSKVKQSVSDNLCYKDSIRNAAINCDFESCDKLLKNVNDLFMNLQKSNDPDTFYSSFTSLISSKINFHDTGSFYCYSYGNKPSKTKTSRASERKRTKHSHPKSSAFD